MDELLVIIVEEADALRRVVHGEDSFAASDTVRSYLLGKLHALEAVERHLRMQKRGNP